MAGFKGVWSITRVRDQFSLKPLSIFLSQFSWHKGIGALLNQLHEQTIRGHYKLFYPTSNEILMTCHIESVLGNTIAGGWDNDRLAQHDILCFYVKYPNLPRYWRRTPGRGLSTFSVPPHTSHPDSGTTVSLYSATNDRVIIFHFLKCSSSREYINQVILHMQHYTGL